MLDKNTRRPNRYTDSLQKHRPIQWAPCIPCPWLWILYCWYVTSRCTLTSDPLTLNVVHRVSRNQTLYQIWANSNNPRQS